MGARIAVAALLTLVACGLPATAGAWATRECDGQPSRWVADEAPMMELEARWGERGTSWGDALRRGMLAWNDGAAARRMFRWRERRMDRVVHGNRRNEITVVTPASIDGALGLTEMRRWHCWGDPWPRGDRRIVEADVMIARFQPGSGHYEERVPNCDLHANGDFRPLRFGGFEVEDAEAYASTREATIIHEFGHALGLVHDDSEMALMMTTGGEGRYCGSPQFAPHPDDLEGMRALYGAGQLDDLAASVFRRVRGRHRVAIGMLDRNRVAHLCPGELISVGWAAANRGTAAARFDVWWFASQTASFDRPDDLLLAVDRGRRLAAETYASDGRRWLRMPRHMPPDVPHYVGFLLSPTDRPDSNYGNNLSYSALRLVRRPDGECR